MAQNQTSPATKRISTYLMLIVLIVIALSIASLLLAANSYLTNPNDPVPAAFLAIIGLVAMTMSIFVLYQSKRQAVQMKMEIPKVMTTIECKKCGVKTVREYQRGDYVYKELDACQKCPDTKQIITSIYKEVKEKEKTYAV